MSNQIAKYLVIGYRSDAEEFFLGIVVLAPHSDELHMQWRDDLQFVPIRMISKSSLICAPMSSNSPKRRDDNGCSTGWLIP